MLFQRFQNPSSFYARKSDGCLFSPPFISPSPLPFSFNPPDGPLSTPNTVSFGLQSCPHAGGFKRCLKVWVKGLQREHSNCKRWFLWLYLEWSLCTSRTCKVCCTLTTTAVFIATFNWLGSQIYAAKRIAWTDEVLQCATLKQACTVGSQHNSASWYWSSDLELCSLGKNVTRDGDSKSFAIPSLGISCLHFLSFSCLKMLFFLFHNSLVYLFWTSLKCQSPVHTGTEYRILF